jgi:non-structural maintenance of chromosomes element 4
MTHVNIIILPSTAKKTDFEDVAGILKQINSFVKSADVLNTEGTAKAHENASELLLDAQVIKMGHELVGAVTQKIGNSEFHEQDFANAIVSFFFILTILVCPKRFIYLQIGLIFNGGSENWNNFVPIASEVMKTFKFSQSMLGTFELEPEILLSQPKERIRRPKGVLSQQKRPETVDKLQKEEKGSQKLNVIMNQIAKVCSLLTVNHQIVGY